MFLFHDRKLVILATGIFTVSIWSADAFTQYMLFRAFGVHIPFYYVLGMTSASFIIGALSFLPGGLGAREVVFATLTSLILTTTENSFHLGLAVAIVYKGIVYLIIGLGAVYAVSSLPSESTK
jgi:uncharacterized protein (TIRG00374 family)